MRRIRIKETEHEAQAAVVAWARIHEYQYPDLRWLYAVPNGAALPQKQDRKGRWYSPQAAKLKEEGLKPGVSDLVLPVPRGGFCGLFMETKVGDNRPSQAQLDWIIGMNAVGNLALVYYGVDEGIKILQGYITGAYRRE